MKFPQAKTPLLKAFELGVSLGFSNLYLKDESTQRFGTWKDRRSKMILVQASKKKIDRLVMITSGNSGYSLAKFAQQTNIKVSLVVDEAIPVSLKRRLKQVCDHLIIQDLSTKVLTSKQLVALAREDETEKAWDVTNGFEGAFELIIQEIKQLKPDYVICPVGSGEGFIGLYDGLQKSGLHTRLIGVSPRNKKSLADKLTTIWSPYTEKLTEISKREHRIIRVSEKTIQKSFNLAKKHFTCEPSSAIVLAGLRVLRAEKESVIVLINSGKGSDALPPAGATIDKKPNI